MAAIRNIQSMSPFVSIVSRIMNMVLDMKILQTFKCEVPCLWIKAALGRGLKRIGL